MSGGVFEVPAGAGNSVSANNVEITDASGPEFASNIRPGTCLAANTSVDVTRSGRVTYTVQFVTSGSCNSVLEDPLITLTSAAFSGCSLTAPPGSTFPTTPDDSSVEGSVRGDILTLSAALLSHAAVNPPLYTASWQLSGCPEVSKADHVGSWCSAAGELGAENSSLVTDSLFLYCPYSTHRCLSRIALGVFALLTPGFCRYRV